MDMTENKPQKTCITSLKSPLLLVKSHPVINCYRLGRLWFISDNNISISLFQRTAFFF
jgi:hypothetical protein